MRRIGDYSEEKAVTWLQRQTLGGLALKFIAVVVALSLCATGGHFLFGWFNTGVQVVSPDNVKAQWQFAYDYDASLKAIAKQWCTARQNEIAETNPEYRVQFQVQRTGIENNYQRVKSEYDGRLRDAFRARLVKPPDVPQAAPELTQTITNMGGCAVNAP